MADYICRSRTCDTGFSPLLYTQIPCRQGARIFGQTNQTGSAGVTRPEFGGQEGNMRRSYKTGQVHVCRFLCATARHLLAASMPLPKYYCDYCDRTFHDTPAARKKHLLSKTHQQNYKLHYDSFKGMHSVAVFIFFRCLRFFPPSFVFSPLFLFYMLCTFYWND
jgi:hypothetical protein